MLHDGIIVLLTWMLFSLTTLVSAPIVAKLFGKWLADAGWAFNRTLGWLLISIPVWFLAHLRIGINTSGGIWLVLLLLLGISAWIFKKHQTEILERLQKAKPLIIAEEILFAFGLVFLSIIRGFQPDINGLEKFMDAGLINSYLQSPTLPIADMWLAGYTFNYYTFGHFLGSVATQIIRQPLEVSYNLLLAIIMGLMLIQSFGLIVTLLKKSHSLFSTIASASLGSLLVVFGGNSQHIWYWLSNRSFSGYWYPDATRFIPFTIHEFPAYSFIVSDLHAHVWSMVLVLVLLVFYYIWVQQVQHKAAITLSLNKDNLLLSTIPIGFLLGIIASTSTWDTLIYGLFLAILSLVLLITSKGKWLKTVVLSAIVVSIAAVIAASPWFLTFTSISEGARLVSERSELWRFLALWITHLVITGSASIWLIIRLVKKRRLPTIPELFVLVTIVTSWILLLLPEIFYMKDIYPSHPRANTMFKLTFQAFILMNLVFGWFFGTVRNQIRQPLTKKVVTATLFLTGAVLLVYPYFGYRDYYNLKMHQYRGLDGLSWLESLHPSDFAGITWLRNTVTNKPVILEAVGESYTTFARVSTFTGFPTVLGWRVHEWLWRGSFDIPGQRTTEVQSIYEQPLSEYSRTKLREYQVEYIFVGDKEREAYPAIQEPQIKSLGTVVFAQGNTFIVQLNSASPLQSRVQ